MTGAWPSAAPDGTHHRRDGQPAYTARYHAVGKFHAPGLAPALNESGAFHIDPNGIPVYVARFKRAFGFYEGLAAVEGDDGWFHVRPDGAPAYHRRWAWCGNVQECRVTVRDAHGRYHHLDAQGDSVGRAWRYAGDFKDGVAVVMGDDGRSTHVDAAGALVHGRWFLDLDVFHKGYARARDEAGWAHIDGTGASTYRRRFAMVEPFYNGQARVERADGGLEVVDERGETIVELRGGSDRRDGTVRYRKLLLVGLPGAGKTTVGDALVARLGVPVHRLDTFRNALADGTVAGDYLARSAFLRACHAPNAAIYEFSAAGYHRVAVRQALREAGDTLLTVWIDTPGGVRAERLARRTSTVPLPDWGIAPGAFDDRMEAKLRADFDAGFWEIQPGWRGLRLDGTLPVETLVDTLVGAWSALGGTE
ncbi:MAG: AAA family ATPase [Myxococcota bacterium]